MKSSLKTFLAGKNPCVREISGGLLDVGLENARPYLDNDHNDVVIDGNGETWYIDILDDGTAINYCKD